MRTVKLLIPALLAAVVVTALPEVSEARPRGFAHTNRWNARGHKNVPELSVGAAAAALGLLGGGLMVITGRRRKRD